MRRGCVCVCLTWSIDIDEKSIRHAKENVKRNLKRLGDKGRIVIFENSPKAEIFPIRQLGLEGYSPPPPHPESDRTILTGGIWVKA